VKRLCPNLEPHQAAALRPANDNRPLFARLICFANRGCELPETLTRYEIEQISFGLLARLSLEEDLEFRPQAHPLCRLSGLMSNDMLTSRHGCESSPGLRDTRRRADMSDHVADIKKYAKKPVDEAAVARLAKTYQLVLSKPDAKYVACSDKEELDRVRENFLKKKLKLESGDLDGAIKAVCTTMKASHSKSRLTFYYLLAEHFEKLDAV
jgi:hypothetical protein